MIRSRRRIEELFEPGLEARLSGDDKGLCRAGLMVIDELPDFRRCHSSIGLFQLLPGGGIRLVGIYRFVGIKVGFRSIFIVSIRIFFEGLSKLC